MMYLQEQFRRQRHYQLKYDLFCYNMKVKTLILYQNKSYLSSETVPVNTSFLIINKDAFLLRCKLGKTIISIRTVYHYAPPNYSSHQTFITYIL